MTITRAVGDSTTMVGASFLPQRAHNLIWGEKTSRVQGSRKVQQSCIPYECTAQKKRLVMGKSFEMKHLTFT